MALQQGQAEQIIVGAAALFVANGTIEGGPGVDDPLTSDVALPDFQASTQYTDTLQAVSDLPSPNNVVTNVGYTSEGLELTFTPDIGEVQVDQVLDAAKLFKQGMQATMTTMLAETTLQNLLYALAYDDTAIDDTDAKEVVFELSAGKIGDCPVERGFVAIGPGSGDCPSNIERVYIGYRGLNTEAVTISAKRDAASMFDMNLRLLPNNAGSYGEIIDHDFS